MKRTFLMLLLIIALPVLAFADQFNSYTDDTTISDADELIFWDGSVKNITWANFLIEFDADTNYLDILDIDDTPVNGETSAPISSNWAYDFANTTLPATYEPLDSAIVKSDEAEAITSAWEFQGGIKVDGYLQLFDTCLSSAPGSPIDGAFYCADYTNWDPITYSGAVAYIVQYDGASYIGKFDIDGNNIETAPPIIEGDPDSIDVTLATNGVDLYQGGYIRCTADGEIDDLDAFTIVGQFVYIDAPTSVIVNPDTAQHFSQQRVDYSADEAFVTSGEAVCLLLYLGSNEILLSCGPNDNVAQETP